MRHWPGNLFGLKEHRKQLAHVGGHGVSQTPFKT